MIIIPYNIPGTFCPRRYPHSFNDGRSCCSSALRSEACSTPGKLEISDHCCNGSRYPCMGNDPTYTCKDMPEGTWEIWGVWGSCSTNCGVGSRRRTRGFKNGKIPSAGNSIETVTCTGKLNKWSKLLECVLSHMTEVITI